ncbi:hypothetical protein M405DRAFT_814202 [Rhizopogon salebrosus TDB-379]|nr:hypothetical protein M405DRAFT_814202 [Rhizopogon salebrosus TDB-379]
MPAKYREAFLMTDGTVYIPPHVVFVLIHTAAMLLHPHRHRIHMPSSLVFPRSSAALS